MTISEVPNRPSGAESRSISALLDNFDYITEYIASNEGGWLGGVGSTVSALPGSPVDNQEIVFEVTEGVVWHLKYNAGSASSYKWEFLGGVPLWSAVLPDQTTTSSSYADLATTGPSITLPLVGDYDVAIETLASLSVVGTTAMSYAIGGTAANDTDAAHIGCLTANAITNGFRRSRKTGLTAVALTAKYKTNSGGTAHFQNRGMIVTPVRVG